MKLAIGGVMVMLGSARADPPALAVVTGVAVREAWQQNESAAAPAWSALVGYRVWPHLALGVHAGFAYRARFVTMFPVDLALAAQVDSTSGRQGLAAWIGIHEAIGTDSESSDVPRSVGFGLTWSATITPDLPLALLVELEGATDWEPYTALTVGVAYRR